jgi:lipid-binding SYLF domain-containing protein
MYSKEENKLINQLIIQKARKMKTQLTLVTLMLAFFVTANAQIGAWDPELEEKSQEIITIYQDTNSNFAAYFEESYGYAIFPSVGKGAVGIGGAHGKGIVYENGIAIGGAKMTQVTIGFQWGGQAYSEIIFFEDEMALERFKSNKVEFAGQASAIAVTKGASADISFKDGIAVYTMPKAGFMYEASIGGQKFKYTPMGE